MAPTAMARNRRNRDRLAGPVTMTFLYVFLLVFALASAFPFYFMLVTSTYRTVDILRIPPPFWFGSAWMQNYTQLISKDGLPYFWTAVLNSLSIASVYTVAVLFFCSLGGYGFAKFRFPGRDALFTFLIATLMVPGALGLIPSFVVMRTLGWIETWYPLIVPGMANAFGIFWMRQYIESAVPNDMMDAARIDGAHEFGIYTGIVLPVIAPALGALAILTFMGKWNEFQFPLLILKAQETYTLPVALSTLRSLRGTEIGVQILGSSIAIIPILIVFIMASRQFMAGLTAGAVK